jgi:hypothetical protein
LLKGKVANLTPNTENNAIQARRAIPSEDDIADT